LETFVGKLARADRHAVLLRFYERKTFPEVGIAMGISEEAARKRVSRAVGRLSRMFARQGVAVPTTALAGLLIDHVTPPASAAFLATGAGATTTTASTILKASSATSASGPMALAKGASMMMTLAKIKMAALAAVLFLLLAGAGITVVAAAVGRDEKPPGAVVPSAISSPVAAATGNRFVTTLVLTESKGDKETVVAEPTLTAADGEQASYFSGGDAPVGDRTADTVPFGNEVRVKVRELAPDQLRVSMYALQSEIVNHGNPNYEIYEKAVRCVRTVKPGEKIEATLRSGMKVVATFDRLPAKQ
jgi:hypothetical protein